LGENGEAIKRNCRDFEIQKIGHCFGFGSGKRQKCSFFGKKSFDVVGVDKSPEAIKDFLENAKKAGVCVKGVML
jgi:hypothetical protein